MHFVTDTILALVSGLAIAIPSPPLLSRDELALHVSQFGAFLSNDSRIPSHVSFHVVDSHPDHPGETNCVFVTQDSHSLFGSGWMISSCDPGLEFDFYLRQDSMKLSRLFYMDPADKEWGKATGLTEWQKTYWSEGTNATKTAVGTFFSRTVDWVFPIATINF